MRKTSLQKRFVLSKKLTLSDWMFVIAAPLFATFITAYFKTSFLLSIFLYFIVPSIYLTIRDSRFLRKIFIMVIVSVPFTILVDYFATRDGTWLTSTMFPFRIMNGFVLEDFIWVAAWFYYVVSFYEYFLDQPRNAKDAPLNPRYKTLLMGWFGALGIFGVLYFCIEKYLYIPFFYLTFTLSFGISPFIVIATKRPQFIYKFLPAVIYFFFLSFLHEWSSLRSNGYFLDKILSVGSNSREVLSFQSRNLPRG